MNRARTISTVERWNRKLHIYVGLYLLLFIWLFSVSGLMMNHTAWFSNRIERYSEVQTVTVPSDGTNLAKAKAVMRQLGVTGEVLLRGVQKEGHFNFGIIRPNKRVFVNVDLRTGIAKLNNVDLPVPGTLGDLHTFTGVRRIWREEPSIRDWLPTQIWSVCIDAISIGLIFLTGSSFYLGWRIKQQRVGFIVSLAAGSAVCAFFIWGLLLIE
ncbi:MAG: PepSY-associated TM helix domain-containing protein [Planctomycetales bacterium]|nr:PepSY-associated TM helix domain-containing protein [Planctomycetales bacterium]